VSRLERLAMGSRRSAPPLDAAIRHSQVIWHSLTKSAHNRASGGFLMSFRPLHDRVLIRRIEQEERTAGGVIIPDTAKEKPMEGEVIAVGPGSRDEKGAIRPLDVKAGDRVLFGKWSGTEVKLDGEE